MESHSGVSVSLLLSLSLSLSFPLYLDCQSVGRASWTNDIAALTSDSLLQSRTVERSLSLSFRTSAQLSDDRRD